MSSFFNALPGALSQGLIWGIMAIGLYITYKVLELSDLTVDGSFCTGGAVCVMATASKLKKKCEKTGLTVFFASGLANFSEKVGIFHEFVSDFYQTMLYCITEFQNFKCKHKKFLKRQEKKI